MGWKARWWETLWSLLVVCKRGWSGGGQGGLQGEADRRRGELFKGSSSLRLIVLTCIRWPTSILTIARPLWADSRTGFWSRAGPPPSSPSACKRWTNSTKSDRNHSNMQLDFQGVVVPVFNPGQGPLLEREIATQAILK